MVVKQKPVSLDLSKNRRRNRLVAAFGQPATGLVPSTEVQAKGYSRRRTDHRIVELEGTVQPLLHAHRAPALGRLLLVKAPSRRIDQESVMRSIDLDVGAPRRANSATSSQRISVTSARNDSGVGQA